MSDTDRELLTLAAKAAGIEGVYREAPNGERGIGVHYGYRWWNPLTNDDDALRLAVRLQLEINATIPDKPTISVYGNNKGRMIAAHEDKSKDPYAATRRAIVRTAAEIGRTMP